MHGGREKVIWAGGRRKVNGAGVGGSGTEDGGPRKSNTHVCVSIKEMLKTKRGK